MDSNLDLTGLFRQYQGKLLSWYTSLVLLITRQQSKFILWPASIVFVISYPALYSFVSQIPHSSTASTSNLVDVLALNNSTDFGFESRQVWIQPSLETIPQEGYALTKKFLMDSLEVQTSLLEGIDLNQGLLHSVFEFWNNDLDVLNSSQNLLRTVQKHDNSHLEHDGILAGIVRVDGVVISAEALKISLIFEKGSKIGSQWDENVSKFQSQKFTLLTPSSSSNRIYEFKYIPFAYFGFTLCNISYLLVIIYVVMSISNVQSVKSRVGLLVAFVVEIALSLLSSATITSYFFTELDLMEVPMQILAFVVIIVGLENMFRLINAVSQTSEDLPMNRRFVDAFITQSYLSTIIVVVDAFLLLGLVPLFIGAGKSTLQFCLFASLAILIDHFMHLTYFTSVLYIDMRRMELEDLIQEQSNHKPPKTLLQRSKLDSVKRAMETYIGRAQLPLTTTVTGSVVCALFLLFANITWMGREVVDSSSVNLIPSGFQYAFEDTTKKIPCTTRYVPYFLSKKAHAYEMLKFFDRKTIALSVSEPVVIAYSSSLSGSVAFDLSTVYNYDIYYVLEFAACLIFILSTAVIIMKYSLDKKDISQLQEDQEEEGVLDSNGRACFQSKELTRGHFLDIVRISTSSCPFVVTVGMDHKVLVWSPLSLPLPMPSQLPVSGKLLPIIDVILSNSGGFIVIVSKSGVLKCWSRLTMSWIWTIQIDALKNGRALEYFFRKRTKSSVGSRRLRVSRPSRLSTVESNETINETTKEADTQKALSPQRQSRSIDTNSMIQQIRSMSIDSAYDRSNNLKALSENTKKDFITVLPDGTIYVISCEDGSVTKFDASSQPLVCAKKLISPRVNDRLVCLTADGTLVVGTVINNKWKIRKVHIQKESYNSGKSLTTPATLSRTSSMDYQSYSQFQAFKHTAPSLDSTTPPSVEKKDYSSAEIATVPFVGMVVCAHGTKADLIDVQTGTLMKTFEISEFKKGTFNVFHPDPYHCRFCGCASVSSFSLAYIEKDSKTLVLHTFSIDNRAKNNICLRVERDPRETRCLGFDSVSEHQYCSSNVEGWCTTDLNMLIGVRKKNVEDIPSTREAGLRNRKLHRSSSTKIPSLSDIWEGWTLSATGKTRTFEIPNGTDQGLLIKSIGPVAKFGHKSIICSFGNVMKILYLGNDNLIEEGDLDKEGISGLSSNENSTALSFINRRRKMTLKKYNLTHSTKFNDPLDAD
ncbi:unnamed protein product [Kuraishia capsulata CBS 1993]|uniref:Sterol regulatory element-binding protein cleavage-activating protein n=1 Tax=Kuraishia capsulata CBS 1993 TaxID=1382522 RepID=W6MTD5_9ASCO|nr:uncharacterized protein KUCA_T00004445001 [Kuraishia capsulata CBS 1993]CDK28462.1 unnamed protein product [Kuraishia capsulata CBS 1993]